MDRPTYQERVDALVARKREHTRAKQKLGPMDVDDHGSILPEEEVVFEPKPNHPSGGSFGPKSVGENFGRLLAALPAYVNPTSSLLGAWYRDTPSYRTGPGWPPEPEFSFAHLQEDIEKYNIISGIGGGQHFCPDLQIGLDLGWGGLLDKLRRYRKENPDRAHFYDGHEATILGTQAWIRRHVEKAREMAEREENAFLRENLLQMADLNEHLISGPPRTFREACQFVTWVVLVTRMFNGSGAIGLLDEFLWPYYEREVAAGTLDDEEARFHLICMLVIDTQYYQVGGPDEQDQDRTNRISFLMLEAAHALKIPSNITLMVWGGLNPDLLDMAVSHLFEDRTGAPRFMGAKGLHEGFMRNGYPRELARKRVACGCHWIALPGIEYTLNDVVKINMAKVFDVAFREFMENSPEKNVDALWGSFETHLRKSIDVTKQGLDFHMAHQMDVLPEVPLNLFCYGTVERGRDVTDGGVDYYNMCIDLSALATAADSFAAIRQRIDQEGRLTYEELLSHLDNNWEGAEEVRLMMKNIRRYGCGDTYGDECAKRLSRRFTETVKESPTPNGLNCIPGIFSWASTIPMGRAVGATPNGRLAGDPISHGANPDPGYDGKSSGSPTSLSNAVVGVQCGYGNTIPLQLDMDPGLGDDEESRERVKALIVSHFDQDGTLINLNILNRDQILEAHEDPSRHPDLIVRVTGFSAYFASLSKEFRQLVVDRIVQG